jgi:hypothetical protein
VNHVAAPSLEDDNSRISTVIMWHGPSQPRLYGNMLDGRAGRIKKQQEPHHLILLWCFPFVFCILNTVIIQHIPPQKDYKNSMLVIDGFCFSV